MSHVVRMKTMAQLLKEGWVMDGDKLTKTGKVPIEKTDFPFLGIQIDLDKKPGVLHGWRWVDSMGTVWSKDVVGEILFAPDSMAARAPSPVRTVKPCVCNIRQLMDVGCRCGGFAAEQAAKRQGAVQ